MRVKVNRTGLVIKPNAARVLFRPFRLFGDARSMKVMARIMALSDDEVERLLGEVLKEFRGRHIKLLPFFLQRFEQVSEHLLTDQRLSENRRLLIGAYFTQEYSLESAALFNPSMVWHPDQSGLEAGQRRFILSLRATGEGHISSITFRSGVVDERGNIHLDPATPYVQAPKIVPDPSYDKILFRRKLFELEHYNEFAERVLEALKEQFTMRELRIRVDATLKAFRAQGRTGEATVRAILALAEANYEIDYEPDHTLSERIIFPHSPTEINGIEDARFVTFTEDEGTVRYLATYTAYDGKVIFPQLVETSDFLRFKINTLNGPQVQNKGLALFPRKVNGRYAMLSRQDGENIFLMQSDYLHFWYEKQIVVRPTYAWEFVQLGNCGSPIETDKGWLVLSHGVGPMRKYSIGALLLDLDNPVRVIGRLAEPLLTPDQNEREGYVPNVVYSCGAVIHGEWLIIPYAMSDYASTFATVKVNELLDALVAGV
jgi:predicted GH43/DUF377 family glycosyl hydrolase